MRTTSNKLFAACLMALSAACSSNNGNYDASGTFEATEIIVSAEANGKLMQFGIEEGQQLEAGNIIGCIDTVQLYLKKMQLLANLKSVQSNRPDIAKQIAATKEEISKAQTEKKRNENLLKSGAATQKQVDDIVSQTAVLEKQLAAQISTLQNSNNSLNEESAAVEIQIAQIDDQLKKCRISSPVNGTVLAKYAEEGELAASGKPLFKIADLRKMILRAYITSGQLSRIKLGDRVQVFTDFGENGQKEYEGVITWISDKSEFTPKTIQTKDERANLVYAIKIAVENDGLVKIGMYGEVKLNEQQ